MANHYFAVQTHGGRCCGIKTIWNFPYGPDSRFEAKAKLPGIKNDVDIYGRGVRKDFNWCREKRPAESAKDRFDSVVAYIIEKRPKGLIEVVLSPYQVDKWSNTLANKGFKVVTTFQNSNTGGTRLTVYHLAYD